MHELGIVFHIADSVVRVAESNGAKRVHEVVLEVGQVSTIIPSYLIDVWNWNCRRVPLLNDCRLTVEEIHAVTFCEGCGKEYDTVPQGRLCPHCGSERTWLKTGNEVNIRDITIE